MNSCKRNSTLSIATKFSNLCQYGEYASLCFRVILKSNDIPVEWMNYIYCCNYFSFNLFDLQTLFTEHASCITPDNFKSKSDVPHSANEIYVLGMLTTVGLLVVLKKGTKCGSKTDRNKTSFTDGVQGYHPFNTINNNTKHSTWNSHNHMKATHTHTHTHTHPKGHKLHAPLLHVLLTICKHALDHSTSNHQHSSWHHHFGHQWSFVSLYSWSPINFPI